MIDGKKMLNTIADYLEAHHTSDTVIMLRAAAVLLGFVPSYSQSDALNELFGAGENATGDDNA